MTTDQMGRLEYAALGPVTVRRDGQVLDVGPPKARQVLAMLLCRGNDPVSVDSLVDGLWLEAAPKSAVKNIQAYIHRLRRAMGDHGRIVRDGPGNYRLIVRPGEFDIAEFERLIRAARQAADTDPARAGRQFRRALALWRDDHAYAGMPDVPLVFTETRRLAESRLSAWFGAVDMDLRLGRYEQVVPELTELTERYPLHEQAWVRLMTALYRSGRRGDALRAYETIRRVLVQEMGVDPGDDLQDLQGVILGARPHVVRGGRAALIGP